jgi:predicted enzyme related to lactoylglutathione lyase
MFRGFATINYFADDVTAAQAWYTEVLGTRPYFRRDVEGRPAYVEYRIGDHQAELGIVDSRYAPHGTSGGPITHWHVDDLEATFARLLALGATQLQGITPRGEGFATAAVTDPFGNTIGIMTNPHYLAVLAGRD